MIALDAVTASFAIDTSLTIAHTPVGTPRGVVVLVQTSLVGTDVITGVTYGGVTLAEAPGSPLLKSTTEVMSVHAYYLGAGVPTGNQSAVITADGSQVIGGTVITLTSLLDVNLVSVATISNDAVADPSVSLPLRASSSFVALVFCSGKENVADITPLANWTSRFEGVFTTTAVGTYTYDTINTADVTAGWTQTSDDALGIAIAFTDGPLVGSGGWSWPRWLGATVDAVGAATSGLYYIIRRRREGKPHE